ncbi:MAG TPA: acyclic terpene utilization AtuA family protein [Acidobacteriota bacterium]|nr:acyclic terpene utilization AtuA family protein [Acidobacteriota bacterium]
MAKDKTVRVGNAGGYWGDDLEAFQRQLSLGPLDYISLDFLAEITMSILQKQRSRDPEMGYARDFVDQVEKALPLLAQSGTKVISNAGGINPSGCARQIAEAARKAGVDLPIAVVEGDDLMERLDELLARGHKLSNMETGQDLSAVRERVQSANAYLGATPVIKALEMGGQVIVTGRVTDTGITIAGPAFEFGWDLTDWDRLASAVVAGHIIECGAQASGGNLTDWREVKSFQQMGYPIVEFSQDGSFLVSKHEKAGGLVNEKTVSEQLVYEMGDPQEYITPDVVAEFSSIRLQDLGSNQVRISGVTGRRRTESLKASISYHDGYKAQGTVIVSRPEAVEKCRAIEEIFLRRLGLDFEETRANLVGYNACHQHLAGEGDPPEILLQVGVRDRDKGKVAEFSKQFPSVILSTVPGVAIVGARPRIQDVVAYWPCLLPAEEVTPRVSLLGGGESVTVPWTAPPDRAGAPSRSGDAGQEELTRPPEGPRQEVPLQRLAYARSGDKGNTCNIGVVARSPSAYAFLRRELTAEKVKAYFGEICQGQVERFEVPNIKALNFLLHESLGGGGTLSLGIDPQGKTYAHALLLMKMEVPRALLEQI